MAGAELHILDLGAVDEKGSNYSLHGCANLMVTFWPWFAQKQNSCMF